MSDFKRHCLFFYLRKLSLFYGHFSSTAIVIDTFYEKYCSVPTQYAMYKNDLKIAITCLSKKIIFLDPFFYAILYDQKFE